MTEQTATPEKSKITDQEMMEKVFKEMRSKFIESFKENKRIDNIFFLLVKNPAMDGVIALGLPMPNNYEGATADHADFLRHLIKEFKRNPPGNSQLIGVTWVMDAHMSFVKKEDTISPDGKLKNFVRPSQDINAKDALVFILETSFKKHSVIHEYITSDEGEVVVQEIPTVDDFSVYDSREAKLSKFAFMFTEGANVN